MRAHSSQMSAKVYPLRYVALGLTTSSSPRETDASIKRACLLRPTTLGTADSTRAP